MVCVLNRNLREKTWRMSVVLNRGRYGSAQKEKQSAAKGGIVPDGMIERGAPLHRSYVGQTEIGMACLKRSQEKRGYLSLKLDVSPVQRAALCDLARPTMATKRHRSCVVAVRTDRDIFSTTRPDSNGRVSANTVKRVHAVPPMQTAPPQAKASRQASEGTPICDKANTT
ncbi:uncharacterized protein (DUF736 family) [Bradyrhizobium sp. F1.13.3]